MFHPCIFLSFMVLSFSCEESPQGPSTPRRWLFRIVACGVPTLFGAGLIVWILIAQQRLVLDPDTGWPKLQSPPIYLEEPGHEITGHRYLYDPLLGWRNIPGWRATSLGRRLTINSQGLRDREYPYEPPPGVSRILVLGDSYAWGYGVSDEEIFSEVLEKRLAGETKKWEVINTGVSGWGTDQELLFLQEEGLRYRPDVVVLAFFVINDPVNNVNSSQYGLYKPVFADLSLTLANTPVPVPGSGADAFTVDVDQFQLTCAIIGKLERVCAENGCRFVIMKFGKFLHPNNPDVNYLNGKFEFELEKGEHPYYLDLDEAFLDRGYSLRQILEGNNDGHWNAFGHRAAAEILHGYLAEHGLLAEARGH